MPSTTPFDPTQRYQLMQLAASTLTRGIPSGNTLACSTGTWSHQPRKVSYGWLVSGKAAPGAHGARLAVTSQLRGHNVRCRVTASNAAGATTAISPAFFVR